MKWKLLPQECEGTYTFSGKSFITCQLAEDLPPEETLEIAELIQERVKAEGGPITCKSWKTPKVTESLRLIV